MRPALFWFAFCMASGPLPAQDLEPTVYAVSISWQLREQRYYASLAEKLKAQLPMLPALLAADPPRASDSEAIQ